MHLALTITQYSTGCNSALRLWTTNPNETSGAELVAYVEIASGEPLCVAQTLADNRLERGLVFCKALGGHAIESTETRVHDYTKD